MAKGNEIVVNAKHRGVYLEGIIEGNLKPGTCVQIKAGVEPVNGRHTWEAFDGKQDGAPSLVAVLLPDRLQGKLHTDAYTDGDRCFVYIPVMGEELNMLKADVPGTADSVTVGDKFMIDDGTGKIIPFPEGTGLAVAPTFIALESMDGPTADALVHCIYTGR